MHILFITDNFVPESNAPANRTYEHARAWVNSGCQVTVVTCAPNFPVGRVFEGYRNAWKTVEYIDGIRVIRVKTYITANKGFVKRILDYASFGLMSAIQGVFVKKPDVVIGTSPQPFAVISAWFITRLRRKPFVFELRDLWPESITAVSAMKENWLLRCFKRFIHYLYRKADLIVSVTESFKTNLIDKGVDPHKIEVIRNGVDLNVTDLVEQTPEEIRAQYGLPDNRFICGYIGTIGMAHSVNTIIEAAQQCTQEALHFLVMGAGAQAETIAQKAEQLDNVTFIEGKPRQEALAILKALDASIVHLKADPLFKDVIPSKIFEVMAFSKPILMGVDGESKDLVVEQAQAGLGFEPENAAALCAEAERLCNDQELCQQLSNQGRYYVETHFSRDTLAYNMLKIMEELVNKGHNKL